MNIRVVIADDHQIVREGLKSMLEAKQDITVAGMAGNGVEAVRLALELRPDVVVMDVRMPELSGIEATRRIVAEAPGVKVLMLTMESDRRYIVDSLDAGASGFVLKEAAFEELEDAIRSVADGQTYIGPKVTQLILHDYLERIPDRLPLTFSTLTNRERELVQMIADGANSKEMAQKLGVSVKTIEVHRHNIMNKLDLYSTAAITKYAVREGLSSVNTIK